MNIYMPCLAAREKKKKKRFILPLQSEGSVSPYLSGTGADVYPLELKCSKASPATESCTIRTNLTSPAVVMAKEQLLRASETTPKVYGKSLLAALKVGKWCQCLICIISNLCM